MSNHEVTYEVDAERFKEAVDEFARECPDKAMYLSTDKEDYSSHVCLLAAGGRAGVSVDVNGDIQNLFNRSARRLGPELLFKAVVNGGRTLDCYDGFLTDYYKSFGFVEAARMQFDESYAPDGWDVESHGTPDVVFMAFNPGMSTNPIWVASDEWQVAKERSQRVAWY